MLLSKPGEEELGELDELSQKTAEKFETLADTHVLRGMVLSQGNKEAEAKDSFEAARSADAIPLTREGLERLHEGYQAPNPQVHENVESSGTRDKSYPFALETHIQNDESLDLGFDLGPQKGKSVKPEEGKISQDEAGFGVEKVKLLAVFIKNISGAFAKWFDQQHRLDPVYEKRIKTSEWTAVDLNDFNQYFDHP
jgi:hypothetical protein